MGISRLVDAEADTGELIQGASQTFLSTYSPPRMHRVKNQMKTWWSESWTMLRGWDVQYSVDDLLRLLKI